MAHSIGHDLARHPVRDDIAAAREAGFDAQPGLNTGPNWCSSTRALSAQIAPSGKRGQGPLPYTAGMARSPKPKPPPNPFRWFESSPEVIRLVVMMDVKFALHE